MTNHPPKPKRKPFHVIVSNNEYAKQALETTGEAITRFIENNAKLLSDANRSVYKQCKDITEKSGFELSQSVMSGMRLGKQKTCNAYIIYLVAQYWGVDGAEMQYKDFRTEEYKRKSA